MSCIHIQRRELILPKRQRGFFAPAAISSAFRVGAGDFDGTNDYMTRGAGLTGAADSKSGILSVWVRLDAGLGTQRLIGSSASAGTSADRWRASRISLSGPFLIVGNNASGTIILQITSTTSYGASATWLHLLASWNLATAAAHLYVNGVDDLAGGGTLTNDTIDYTVGDWGVGGDSNAGNKLDGCLSELYLATGQYLDFSVAANLRKFITASGRPAYLGRDGSKPTGTQPIMYLHLNKNEAVANLATNRGSGGDPSITGALVAADTSPSG